MVKGMYGLKVKQRLLKRQRSRSNRSILKLIELAIFKGQRTIVQKKVASSRIKAYLRKYVKLNN